MSDSPLLLVDVDGVLNAFRRPGPEWVAARALGFRLLLNPAHGPMLLKLAEETGAELTWATTWEHDANREIGPTVGLPELPVIETGRPRDLDERDESYLEAHAGVGEFLIVHVDGDHGLTDQHFEQARQWLAAQAEQGGA